jgi:hypothetical protein
VIRWITRDAEHYLVIRWITRNAKHYLVIRWITRDAPRTERCPTAKPDANRIVKGCSAAGPRPIDSL